MECKFKELMNTTLHSGTIVVSIECTTNGSEDLVLLTVESFVTVFVFNCCPDLNICYKFIDTDNSRCFLAFDLSLLNYNYEFVPFEKCESLIQKCLLPSVFIMECNWCVSGLCATLRHVLKQHKSTHPLCKRLLGFRGSCLQSCSEVSAWTQFCEVEVIQMMQILYLKQEEFVKDFTFHVPVSLTRFEYHLQCPPVLHNALKHKQQHIKNTCKENGLRDSLIKMKLEDLPDLEHKYAEGIDLSLADFIIYVTFTFLNEELKKFNVISELKEKFPLVFKWYQTIDSDLNVCRGNNLFLMAKQHWQTNKLKKRNEPLKLIFSEISNTSLYKSDPMRLSSRFKSFTNQSDIDNILQNFDDKDVNPSFKSLTADGIISKSNLNKVFSNSKPDLDWENLPFALSPQEGQLPFSRLNRKQQQLSNMVVAVLAVAVDGQCIVDFCAGGGHVGLLVAHFLPGCEVILVENKEHSLRRAFLRAKTLGLKNVTYYQCNMDYFSGAFDVGVTLHACGVATDLVMQKCIAHKAAFVCSPCCYGSVRANPLTYPRSQLYLNHLRMDLDDYLTLCHASDQTHDEDNPKSEQGWLCMKFVDLDRVTEAEEKGYEIDTFVMNPSTCTPKNHILLGKCNK